MRRKDGSEGKNLPMETALAENEKGETGVRLQFNNVWFKYPTRDSTVLNGLNMTVRIGSKSCLTIDS